MRKEVLLKGPHSAAQHRPDEERGREHSAWRSTGEGKSRGHQLEEDEGQQHLPDELAVQRLVDDVVTGSHHLGEPKETNGAHQQTGDCWLKKDVPSRQRTETRAKIAEDAREDRRNQTSEDTEDGVRHQLAGIAKGDRRNAEHRLGSPKPARHDDAGNGGEDQGAEDRRAPAADDLFNHEQDGGDRGVERSGETGSCADRCEHTQAAPGKA